MRRLISRGRLLDPLTDRDEVADILVDNGNIAAVAPGGSIGRARADEIVDAAGLWVTPGLIDMHVHLREPGGERAETVASGCKAAVAGGFAAITAMANTNPPNDSPAVTRLVRSRAESAALAGVFPIAAVTLGLQGQQLSPMELLKEAGVCGFSDDGVPVARADLMREALIRSRELELPVISHAEDPLCGFNGVMNEGEVARKLGLDGISPEAEICMVARDIALAADTGGYLHLAHLSTAGAVELVRQAKRQGLAVTAEATPHHFTLTDKDVARYGAQAKMRPPLRSHDDLIAVREGLGDGTFDAVASDHAPHPAKAKARGMKDAPFGIIGLETTVPLALSLVREGLISPLRFAELLSVGPARALRLPLPSIAPRAEASITIIDPDRQWRFDAACSFSLSANSPFDGWDLTGRASSVIIGDRMLVV